MLATHPDAVRPLIKWAGGKRRLVPEILKISPAKFGTYYEPFLGGGAFFFSILPSRAVLGDLNRELMNMYRQIQDRPESVRRSLRQLRNSEIDYYRIRSARSKSEVRRAARLIYLCSLSFNGIYRQNFQGDFNVPYGRRNHIRPGNAIHIEEVSNALKGHILRDGDFEITVRDAQRGDFIYFDPPYTVAHGDNGFVRYNDHIFSWSDQKRLASLALRLKRAGCKVIVSNADHPSIRNLYASFRSLRIERHSLMSASSKFRRSVYECLFY
jgi:DNA adenine methylase